MKRLITPLLLLGFWMSCFASLQAGPLRAKEGSLSFTSAKEKGKDKTVKLTVRFSGALEITGATGTLQDGIEGTLTLTGGPVTLKGDIYFFTASQQSLTSVDLTNASGLTFLDLSLNQLKQVDLSALPLLKELRIEYNQLEALDLSKNPELAKVYCYVNNIPKLDLSNQKELWLLTCFGNKLTSLDISSCPKLTKLSFDNNPISGGVDFTKNLLLENIWCASTKMTSIDVTKNTKLKQFIINNNALKEVDLSHNPELNLLYIAKNQFSALDISNKPNLRALWIFQNQIKQAAMQNIVEALPMCGANEQAQFIVINSKSSKEGNECRISQVTTAKEKNWLVYDVHSAEEDFSDMIPYGGSATELVMGQRIHFTQGKDFVRVEGAQPNDVVRIITLRAENVMMQEADGSGVAEMSTTPLAQGVYLLMVNDKLISKLILK